MWTNVFRIGGLQQLSWFQFLPNPNNDSDVSSSLPDVCGRSEHRDAAACDREVLSSHLQLHKDGFLTAWTNSFVGPWDPSQGIHNPDDKIKLWLFLPGRHSSVPDTAQPALSRLRVVACGLWVSPGNSEEVGIALSHALRNRLQRAFMDLSYVRFGDVFSRYQPYLQSEELFRKGQPTIEFVFAASEEAIFVHVILSAKYVRTLASGDMEKVLKSSSSILGRRFPVIVSPHGMRGKVAGCCSSDLVEHVYVGSGISRTSSGLVGLPCHASQARCKLRGQNCYMEITLGCITTSTEKGTISNSNHDGPNCSTANALSTTRVDQKGYIGDAPVCERTFVYPTEAVLVPLLQTSFARSSLKRFWLQNWSGLSFYSSTMFMYCGSETDDVDDSWSESDGTRLQHALNSSSNSNSSSISSLSCSSSESEYKTNAISGDLEADADSVTGRQSGLSSADPMEINGPKQGTKRPRMGVEDAFVQASGMINAPAQDYNNSGITGGANEQIGPHWDWDDDDRGMGMDIQALLSEFGDFGDFFENDALPFGEPPGTAESQALIFPAQECGDGGSSPSASVMDVSEQTFLPVGFPTFDSFNPPSTVMEECADVVQEAAISTLSTAPMTCGPGATTGEFDHVLKAEALLSFAPEYGAVETCSSELSQLIFRTPYQPKAQKADSLNSSGNNYVYGPAPPVSPCSSGAPEKPGMAVDSRLHSGKNDISAVIPKFYTQVERGEIAVDKKSVVFNSNVISPEGTSLSMHSGLSCSVPVKSVQSMTSEFPGGAKHLLLSHRTVPAAELECLMFQASMCRIRHSLLSVCTPGSFVWSRYMGTGLSQVPGDPCCTTDNSSSKHEVKKETIPIRIAGDVDGGVLDSPFSAPIGVWRSVETPKPTKPASTPGNEVFPSLSRSPFNDETMVSFGRRQPLQDFLDAISLLVQQAASFVDIALDGECADGPCVWLALQEQHRRGFCCGPHMVHAGCGGILASCHCFDIAGVELPDPISADVQSSSVISMLQSDVRTVLKSAFGTFDGPLSLIDWCKGRQPSDAGAAHEALSAESNVSEYSNSATTSIGDPVSPSQASAGVSSGLREGIKGDESGQRRLNHDVSETEQPLGSRRRPMVLVAPYPSILVGYQDVWLKTSAGSLQLWEKAPLEPYAFPKHMSYYVVCPNIEPLTSAASDFFQQLGTVYETCKLGTHSPYSIGNQTEVDSAKCSMSGFVLLDSPHSMNTESTTASLVGSISDYFISLSNGWDVASFLKSLSKVLKSLQLGSCSAANAKEGHRNCTVIYVVCPFPDPAAVLQTIVESSVAVGSVIFEPQKDNRLVLHSQVGKALSSAAGFEELSVSKIPALSGFSIPRLVLQVVPVVAIFRVTSPSFSELVMLKEIAFTVYNKARCTSRGSAAAGDMGHTSTFSGRSQSMTMSMANPISGMWKDCVGSRLSGTSLPREGELDPGIRTGSWDSTWQTARVGGIGCDPNRSGVLFQEELHYMFEPLFILAEPGSVEQGVSPTLIGNVAMEFSKQVSDDSTGNFFPSSAVCGDAGPSSQLDGSDAEGFGFGQQKSPPSLHCCYGWTEDWRWLVCIWTDSRGELLDDHIFPFGGISSRQDTKGMQNLFVQVLQQGCQILQACSSSDNSTCRPRDFVITRIGCFYELECQEWQKALYSVGGSEAKKWPLQLRRVAPDGTPTSGNGTSVQQQEIERSLPSSPSPLYSPHTKASGYMKGALGQTGGRKQLIVGASVDGSRGLLQWIQSIGFVSISIDHSLQLVSQADISTGSTPGSGGMGPFNYLEGFSHVKSLGSTSASYILIPSPSMRFLTPTPQQLPTCLTSESPPLAHLLHSKGYATPLSTGFVVSKPVPSLRKAANNNLKEDWPSVLSVNLIDYYGGCGVSGDKFGRAIPNQGGRGMHPDAREYELEIHTILESVIAELQALSWMTVSPTYLERRSALPFHCDMVLRLRRLLHYAEMEISRQPEKL